MAENKNDFNLLTSIGFKKYKSFDSDSVFRIFLKNNINVIIGRNNTGKSSVIDILESLSRKPDNGTEVKNLYFSLILSENNIKQVFSPNTFDGYNRNYFDYGKKYIGKELMVEIDGQSVNLSSYQPEINDILSTNQSFLSTWKKMANYSLYVLSNISVRRVNADRDIVPEAESDEEEVYSNGNGATNLVRKFINDSDYDETIIEKTILDELNKIMDPEAFFDDIRIQQVHSRDDKNYKWEIYLEENGNRYALSRSGSGLKTILLILINLYLVPQTEKYKNKNIIFAFEEIENNLHPALQRRVFNYLYDYAQNNNVKIIITTHSHIAIDNFYGRESVGLSHVVKQEGRSSLININNNKDKLNILNDLGVKASDLFQSNGIIWVEGPSDRIYLLKWLEVFTGKKYEEGRDFQFMYYGGKLLAHYTAEEKNEKMKDLINILMTNRNAVILIDSDRKAPGARINETKRRIRDEFINNGLFCWITKGKEIENYLSAEAINSVHESKLKQIDQYALFPEYISSLDKNFSSHKVDSARKYAEYITRANSENILDLEEQVIKLDIILSSW